MKKLLIILLFAAPFKSFAQDPDLFQDWYVNVLESESFGFLFASDVEPAIVPTLSISSGGGDTILINGFAGCNEFTATYIYDSDFEELNYVGFTIGDIVCEESIMYWENNMTNFFVDTLYVWPIVKDSDGQILRIFNFIFESIGATNYILNSPDSEKVKLVIFPNPTQETISWDAASNGAVNVRIYSALGKLVKNVATNVNSIDVSTLSSGLYFIELQDDQAISRAKFIKQ